MLSFITHFIANFGFLRCVRFWQQKIIINLLIYFVKALTEDSGKWPSFLQGKAESLKIKINS
jgi:hypothetical protein